MDTLKDLFLHRWLPRQLVKFLAWLAALLGIANPGEFVSAGTAFVIAIIAAVVEMALSWLSHKSKTVPGLRGLNLNLRSGTRPPIIAIMLSAALLTLCCGTLTSCGTSGVAITGTYNLPHDAGKVEATLFPDKLFAARAGK